MDLDIYIIHCAALAVRKNLILNLLDKLKVSKLFGSINATFVSQHDPNDIVIDQARNLVKLDKNLDDPMYNSLVRNIHIKQLSNVLKHMEALKTIAFKEGRDADSISLVIEDDVVFGDNVELLLQSVLNRLKPNGDFKEPWDVMFLGFPQPITTTSDKLAAPANEFFKICPTTDSYLITKSKAKMMLDSYVPIRFTNNIQMSWVMKTLNFKPYFSTPNIFADGSKYGVYISVLDPNNRLILNHEYKQLFQTVAKDVMSKEEKESTAKLLENIRFKNHPDVMYQAAMFNAKMGNIKVAQLGFEEALKIYVTNDAIIDSNSEFLMNYIKLHKYIQREAEPELFA